MKRREFIGLVSGLAVWPIAGHAQPTAKVTRIGSLGVASPLEWASKVEALRAGLRDLATWKARTLSSSFAGRRASTSGCPHWRKNWWVKTSDVLVTQATPGVRAAKQATTTIPIVIAAVGDAVPQRA